MKNKGTSEGTEQEIKFIKKLNKNKDLNYWRDLMLNPNGHYAIRVIYKKYGALNQSKILPKADAFIAKGFVDISYLQSRGYFLDEDDVKKFNLKPIIGSGISIKRPDSKKYQIIKMAPSTFKKIFGSNILASGASIYCNKKNEFSKNIEVLDGWMVSQSAFLDYFNSKLNMNLHSVIDQKNKGNLKKIKEYSNQKIADIINNDPEISNFMFFGIGNFTEPFIAWWIYKDGIFEKNSITPFSVTTGSGRRRGTYTIVLKPKP